MVGVVKRFDQAFYSSCRKVKCQQEVQDEDPASRPCDDVGNGFLYAGPDDIRHKVFYQVKQCLLEVSYWYKGDYREQENNERKNG